MRQIHKAALAGLVTVSVILAVSAGMTMTAQETDAVATSDFVPAESDFACIRDMHAVRGFYVDNLLGDVDATLEVANSETGGTYPAGTIIQLVPTEAMVKREAGYNPLTNDWEFFELDVAASGATIRVRGSDEVVNQFGGNCLECHAKAEPQWDLICEQTHGCDPLPLTPAMLKAIQNTDPRCEAVELPADQQQALQMLQAFRAASGPKAD
ncbi:MAG: hypothetical protein CMK09_05880 [Ponticaulis sp.]|nr:hypothetical protein [Ponticaulis sp.]